MAIAFNGKVTRYDGLKQLTARIANNMTDPKPHTAAIRAAEKIGLADTSIGSFSDSESWRTTIKEAQTQAALIITREYEPVVKQAKIALALWIDANRNTACYSKDGKLHESGLCAICESIKALNQLTKE